MKGTFGKGIKLKTAWRERTDIGAEPRERQEPGELAPCMRSVSTLPTLSDFRGSSRDYRLLPPLGKPNKPRAGAT